MTEDLQRRNHELSVLNEIARELNRSINLNDTLRFTLAQVADLLGLSTGWIWLLNEDSAEPYLAACQNLPPALADNPRRMDGTDYCYCLDTYRKGDLEGAANVNVLTCSRLDGLVDGTDGLRYHASIPLYAQEKKARRHERREPGVAEPLSRRPATAVYGGRPALHRRRAGAGSSPGASGSAR